MTYYNECKQRDQPTGALKEYKESIRKKWNQQNVIPLQLQREQYYEKDICVLKNMLRMRGIKTKVNDKTELILLLQSIDEDEL